ncbi:MAG: hypothetical protein EAZ20_12370 [Bacteroidetes bacterium]|nr:MAG: hypothetical protein EAZ20_12370 [Bacteroidota bacterium]
MASIYFDTQGSLVRTDEEGDDKAFYNNQEVPYITGSQLQNYAATIYSESSFMGLVRQINPSDPFGEMQKETFAIAYTMYTYAMTKNAAFKKLKRSYGLADLLVDNNYTKGLSSPAHQQYFQQGVGDEDRRKYATMAVIRLFMRMVGDFAGVIQSLNGAAYWDGNDLFRLYPNHYRCKQGYELSDDAHGTIYQNISVVKNAKVIQTCPATEPKVSAKRKFTFVSCVTYGGTIFFKIHDEAKAQGITW